MTRTTVPPAPALPARTRTFAMLKPDVASDPRIAGEILEMIVAYVPGGGVDAVRELTLTREQAAAFYQEHTGRPYFEGLLDAMTAGPIVAMIISSTAPQAWAHWRAVLGATNPKVAEPGTVRARYGTEGPRNAAHGSDSSEAAEREIAFFFGDAPQA